MSDDPRIGFFAGANALASKLAAGTLPEAQAAVAPQLIFNQQLDGWVTIALTLILWLVIGDMLRVSMRFLRGLPTVGSSEAPYQVSQLQTAGGEGRS
jgi:carbon starvation protein